MSDLKKALKQLVNTNDETYSKICKVDTVDKDKKVCDVTPIDGSAEIFDVRLSSDPDSSYVIYPKEGSNVIVSWLDKNNAFVSAVSNVDVFDLATENENLKDILNDLLDAITQLTVTTSTGASGVPINVSSFLQIKTRLDNLFN